MGCTRLKAEIELIPELSDFVSDQCMTHSVSARESLSVMLIVEELVTNICHYAYPDEPGDFEVDLEFRSDRCLIRITDSGKPFNPTQAEEPDTTLPLDKREVGGLGLLLVRENSDQFQYERVGGRNVVTVTKRLVK